jgi:ATP-dependent exoDNAse (exonuclease V) beta subunit
MSEIADKYLQQVRTYAYAMERIFEKPVKNAYLYFFRLGKFYPV